MKRHIVLAVLAALIIACLASYGIIHAGNLDVLSPRGPVGAAEKSVLLSALLLPGIIVIPVIVLLFSFAWRYRANGPLAKEKRMPNWDHDNWVTEAVWWFFPTAIIVTLAVILWHSAYALDPYRSLSSQTPPITVEVVALDWKWLFIYPEQGVASVNELEIPAGTPVHFKLTADAPMNSFWIPSLGGQIMVMPGMETQLNLLASEPGAYDGYSANISGKGFAGMHFKANAVAQGEFDAWVEHAKESGSALTTAQYLKLAQPSTDVPVSYYASVNPDLYTGIIMNQMMPGMLTATTTMNMSGNAMPMNMQM